MPILEYINPKIKEYIENTNTRKKIDIPSNLELHETIFKISNLTLLRFNYDYSGIVYYFDDYVNFINNRIINKAFNPVIYGLDKTIYLHYRNYDVFRSSFVFSNIKLHKLKVTGSLEIKNGRC